MNRPKKCPVCSSMRISKREPFRCGRCGYVNSFNKPAEVGRYVQKVVK